MPLIYHTEIENRSWQRQALGSLHFLFRRLLHMASVFEARVLKKYLFTFKILSSELRWGPPRLAAGAGDR